MITVIQLEKWLKKKNNHKAMLAAHLGYSSSETINRWVQRNNIPEHQRERVAAFIKKGASQ